MSLPVSQLQAAALSIHQPDPRGNGVSESPHINIENMYATVQPPSMAHGDAVASVLKMEQLFDMMHPWTDGPVIQTGDIFRFQHMIGNIFGNKDVMITNVPSTGSWVLHIPPRGYQDLKPRTYSDNPVYHQIVTDRLNPTKIQELIITIEPLARFKKDWKNIHFLRPARDVYQNVSANEGDNLVLLGTLWDVRQAYNFALNEHSFIDQLACSLGKRRRWNDGKLRNTPGWFMADMSGLYFKMRANDYALFSKAAILDFGTALNTLLASCANPGFMIVPYDIRLLLSCDGLPQPLEPAAGTSVSVDGPMAFPTDYTRALAGCNTQPHLWSRGHAHLGPRAFNKAPLGKPSATFQNVNNDPQGVGMTEGEKNRVSLFHKNHVQGRLLHWPLPIHRDCNNGLDGGFIRRQYYATNVNDQLSWIIDERGPGGVQGVGFV